jgi:hypothetical protein
MQVIRAGLPRDALVVKDATVAAYAWANRMLPVYEPRTAMRKSTVIDLASTQVGWYEDGVTIPLPSLGHDEGRLRWLSDPETGMELPTWAAVVGAVRRASSRRW